MADVKENDKKMNEKEEIEIEGKENEKKNDEKGEEMQGKEDEKKNEKEGKEKDGKENEPKENDEEGKEMQGKDDEKKNEKEGKEKDGKENEKEGKENEKENDEESVAEKPKDDTAIDRFFSWWRGKAKTNLKDEEEENEKDENVAKKDENETNEKSEKKKHVEFVLTEESEAKENEMNKASEKDTEKDAKVINKEEKKNEKDKEEKNEIEKPKVTNSNIENQSGSDKSSSNGGASRDVKKAAKLSTKTDRRLEKILEEQKVARTTAPLAQAEEEEDFDSLDSRAPIDSVTKASESSTAGNQKDELSPKPGELVKDKSETRTSTRVETFVTLSYPFDEERRQRNKDKIVNTCSEKADEVKTVSCGATTKEQDTQPSGKQYITQSKKMEDVIEEQRQDTRRENVQETWQRIDPDAESPKETGNKSFRVSYTIRTETIEKSKKDDSDDDDERLFGNSVLLNSAPTKAYEGPPPENLESEIVEEHAREDEAASTDIDRFFEICKEDGTAPLAKDETETSFQEEKETKPTTAEDIFKILHGWDDEPTDWWTITKKKKEYEEWMKPMKEGTIRRVIIPNVEIPYKTSVAFITDWKYREEWDKTFSEIQVLKSDKSSKIIYCPVKKRDLTFETIEQDESDPPCHVLSWKKQEAIKEDEKTDTLTKKNRSQLQLITHTCGIILRPAESGENATKITILCQLEGVVDKALKNTFLAGHPKTWLRNLKKYYKQHQKGDNKKVVYL